MFDYRPYGPLHDGAINARLQANCCFLSLFCLFFLLFLFLLLFPLWVSQANLTGDGEGHQMGCLGVRWGAGETYAAVG